MYYSESNNHFQRDDGLELTPSQIATLKKKEELKANKFSVSCDFFASGVR
tara:strand:- start:1293 stop:1442 length:150 start_codon:yes stop_codon:yes gene_type:complete